MPENEKTDNGAAEPSPRRASSEDAPETASEKNGPGNEDRETDPKTCPVVGLGASAGGLEALKSFFSNVPKDSGMAYIVAVHMSPKHPSMMPELIQKETPAPVTAAEDGERIAADHVYIIPPDKEIAVYNGEIQLFDISGKKPSPGIDVLLRTLAQDQGANAAAVILSGTGTDGVLGVKDIKAAEGLVLVQSEESAAYSGMPASAIRTGLADLIMTPEKMPEKLIHYFFRHEPFSRAGADATTTTTTTEAQDQKKWLSKIFAVLRSRTGHDFSAYKVNTLLRRISRRMSLNHIDAPEQYVKYLRENKTESETLFRELLIGVTSFFRETESFNILKTDVLPGILAEMEEDGTFLAWTPGCATGEEVYSLAMILRECMDDLPQSITFPLFGTDINAQAVEKAREGLFPKSVSADISSERLKRFFTKEGDFYRIRKEIRDCVVFSAQNLLRDPPFSRLDLLCCRNVLIYLNAEAQKRLTPLFHYTLKPGGVLMLGSSETIGAFSSLFRPIDKKWKIYRRQDVPKSLRPMVNFPSGPSGARNDVQKASETPGTPKTDISRITQKAILDQLAPTAVLVDAEGDILHVQGRTGKYLETPGGPPTHNILDQAREGLRIELSSALRTAKNEDRETVRRQVAVKTNGGTQMINLRVIPQHAPNELAGRFLVVFEDVDGPPSEDGESTPSDSTKVAELEKELQITRESHQTTIEELESSNEELKSTNEELQSANEELQSTNEELESSKEELQSLNEELQTVNAELHNKLEELSAANDDMRNLLNSTEIATIFVDNDLKVRRFTPDAVNIVNLISTDLGRPLRHVMNNLDYDGMIDDIKEVLEKLTPKETEVRTAKGEWYNMRIMPYRTADNRIDGAVLTFSRIGDQKRAQETLKSSTRDAERALELVRAAFDMNDDPMAVLDAGGRIVVANTAFSRLTGVSQDDVGGADPLAVQNDLLNQADLAPKLNAALDEGEDFDAEFETSADDGKRRFVVTGRIIKKDEDFPCRILLRITEQQ